MTVIAVRSFVRVVLPVAAVAGVVGCRSPAPTPFVASRPSEPTLAATPYELPPPSPVPAWHLACDGASPRAIPKSRAIYTYASLPLYPIASGPRIANRSPAGKPRTGVQLEEALHRAEDTLRRCWYWASARGAAETTLDLAFTMTPFGKTTAHSVVDPSGGSHELVLCLQENLTALHIDDVSPRTTRMHARIAFVRVDQPAWPRPPKRPQPRRTRDEDRPKTCTPVLDAAVDQLAGPLTYTISDFSEDRIPPKRGVPIVHVGCTHAGNLRVDKATIRTALDSNRGALQRCHADARARDPSLAGTVSLALIFTDGATPSSVTAGGAGDAALHDCMRAAAAEVWLAEALPARLVVEANFSFELRDPDDAVDHEASLAEAAAAVTAARTDRARCEARTRVVSELASLAPWLDDARLLAATADLATFAARLPTADAKACLARIDETLKTIALGSRGTLVFLRWSQIDRTEALLPVASLVSWGDAMRWLHAATLALSAARHDEGVSALRVVAAEGATPWAGLADDELDRYELPRMVPARHCDRLR